VAVTVAGADTAFDMVRSEHMTKFVYRGAVAATALLCACSRTSNGPELIPDWRKPNPPLWAYVTSSQPEPGDRARRFFINTKPSPDPPDQVEVLVRSQAIYSGEAKDADIPKDDESTAVIAYGCNEQSQTYYLAPRRLSFSGKDWPNVVPPTPEAISFRQYVEGLKPIESGTVDEVMRAAACFLVAPRLREIKARMNALSSGDEQQRGVALRDVINASGRPCDRVDRLLERGSDNKDDTFWGVACRSGEQYHVEIKSKGKGYSVMSCSEYHSVSNSDCFKKLF
jgi:hypothetical protein